MKSAVRVPCVTDTPALESLEPRLLLAADVIITEIMYHPSSESILEEYIELYNRGDLTAHMAGWQFVNGVGLTFPDVDLPPGQYLAVPADSAAFHAKYPAVTNYLQGAWEGRLSNSAEEIRLVNEFGVTVDRVEYADEGDWFVRERGPLDHNHRGWRWSEAHDGLGKSLELLNVALSNNDGQNWSASLVDNGTPGQRNSVATSDIPPMILEAIHSPAIPRSTDPVAITAQIVDELTTGLSVTLWNRVDGAPSFTDSPMYDDGQHGDGDAGDGVYGAIVQPRPNETVVEWYVQAVDAGGKSRTWPAPALVEGQVVNALYQVDDSYNPDAAWTPGSQPVFRLIMTEVERAELAYIGSHSPDDDSDAQMNGTFISVDGTGADIRYVAGFRNRGAGSRTASPQNNYHVNFATDRPWQGVTAINLNGRYSMEEVIGSAIFLAAGLPTQDVQPVQVRVNADNNAVSGYDMFGSYSWLEAEDTDLAENHFPTDGNGNYYRGIRRITDNGDHANLSYQGPVADATHYTWDYSKKTNVQDNEWDDLIALCRAFDGGQTPDAVFVQTISQQINVDEWLRYFACATLIGDQETTLSTGYGDDYSLYRGFIDTRFQVIVHDLDTILGRGEGTANPTESIFRAADRLTAINRLLRNPTFGPRYYWHLKDLIDTVYSPAQLRPLMNNVLGGYVSSSVIDGMMNFVAQRTASVLSQIPGDLTITTSLTQQDGYYVTTSPTIPLGGLADAARTRSVLVNGQPVPYSTLTGTWGSGVTQQESLFGAGSLWHYLDDGSNQGTAWKEFSFPAAENWPEGKAELGYGENDEATPISNGGDPNNVTPAYYFRQTFNVPNPSRYTSLKIRVKRDDGVAVYLNGERIVLDNLQDGAAYNTYTGTDCSDDGKTWWEWSVDPAKLRLGTNVLAAEVHQSKANSSDVSFDLELLGGVGTAATPVQPGLNHIVVQALDESGREVDRGAIDVRYNTGTTIDVSGTLPVGTTTWGPSQGAYRVTGTLTVPAGALLAIQPGTMVFFNSGFGLTVNGRLDAQGTESRRIRFTRTAGGGSWAGLDFTDAQGENVVAYADIAYSDSGSRSVHALRSSVTLDHIIWSNHTKQYLTFDDSSIILTNSYLPSVTDVEMVHYWGFPADGHALIAGNTFGSTTGYNDIIDFTGGQRPGPIAQFLNNVFLGGSDDGIDMDATDAHVEGNVFMNFHQDAPRESLSHAVSTGTEYGQISEITVVRNLFYNLDHGVLIKDGGYGTIVNNTFVHVTKAAVNVYEARSGQWQGDGVYLDGNIFYDVAHMFENPDWAGHPIPITMSNCLFPDIPGDPVVWTGTGNIIGADPRLTNTANVTDPWEDFRLLPGSPAIGTGPNGRDMGGVVPAGASIAGEPSAVTRQTSATLTVGGPDIWGYRYRLNDGPWTEIVVNPTYPDDPVPPLPPIELHDLADGAYTVYVITKNSAGFWQGESEAVASRTWLVNSSLSRLIINEVLAVNDAAFEHEGTFPDIIELYNDSPLPINIGGMSITDDPAVPQKFIFPAGTVIGGEDYLLLYADSAATSGLHLGFALDGEGERVYLYDHAGGAGLIDSIDFGIQLADLSIGRLAPDGRWGLARPTPGDANVAQATGSPSFLKINEWLTSEDIVLADDFIELYNPDPAPVDLGGLFLTDHPASWPDRYQIPALSFIAGGGYDFFRADENVQLGAQHVSFRLASEQGEIALLDADLNRIDYVLYGPQTTDVSHGRMPNGADKLAFFVLPTPGVRNPGTLPDQTINVDLINIDDVWSYDQSNADLLTAWREYDYPAEASWPTGKALFYVESSSLPAPKNTPLTLKAPGFSTQTITYYFRKHFTFNGDPADVVSLTANTVVDDGAVIYLNAGTNRYLLRMSDPVSHTKYADSPTVDNAVYEGPFALPISALRSGDNVIAVEVHQRNATSTDIVFGLELDATVKLPPQEDDLTALLRLVDSLRITEIMYNPVGGSNYEFIELQNVGQEELDLTGVRIRGGAEFTFPTWTLAPGEYVAVVNNLPSFRSRYGQGPSVAGQFSSGNLSNAGEEIILQLPNPYDAAILRFEYDDAWYPATDGSGPSLVIADPQALRTSWDQKGAWMPSSATGGSPAGPEPSAEYPPGAVVINEVLAHQDAPTGDWIELLNTTDSEIVIGGWFLSDDASDLMKFQIPPGTTLQPGEYIVFTQADDFGQGVIPNGFGLSELGDDLYLSYGSGGQLGRYREYVVFGASDNGVTFGRQPLSNGKVDFVAMASPTPWDANSAPRISPVVVEEIMYHPLEGRDEYLLLRNITAEPVDLFDPAHPENTWKFTDGVEFTFPEGITVPAGGYLMVVPTEPDAFRAKYDIPAEVQVLGPYADNLSNGGETVDLARPGNPEPDGFVPYVVVDHVTYNDGNPWPTRPDGDGPALVRQPLAGYGSEPSNWTFSAGPIAQSWAYQADEIDLPRLTFAFSKIVFAAPEDVTVLDETGTPVAAEFTLAGSGASSIQVSLTAQLHYGGPYTLVLSGQGVTDAAGRGLEDGDYQASFVVAIPGDTDLDGTVDFYDYLTVKGSFGSAGANWSAGDFDYDGDVDFMDYLSVKANFGAVYGGSGVEVLSEAIAPTQARDESATWQATAAEVTGAAEDLPAIPDLPVGPSGPTPTLPLQTDLQAGFASGDVLPVRPVETLADLAAPVDVLGGAEATPATGTDAAAADSEATNLGIVDVLAGSLVRVPLAV